MSIAAIIFLFIFVDVGSRLSHHWPNVGPKIQRTFLPHKLLTYAKDRIITKTMTGKVRDVLGKR